MNEYQYLKSIMDTGETALDDDNVHSWYNSLDSLKKSYVKKLVDVGEEALDDDNLYNWYSSVKADPINTDTDLGTLEDVSIIADQQKKYGDSKEDSPARKPLYIAEYNGKIFPIYNQEELRNFKLQYPNIQIKSVEEEPEQIAKALTDVYNVGETGSRVYTALFPRMARRNIASDGIENRWWEQGSPNATSVGDFVATVSDAVSLPGRAIASIPQLLDVIKGDSKPYTESMGRVISDQEGNFIQRLGGDMARDPLGAIGAGIGGLAAKGILAAGKTLGLGKRLALLGGAGAVSGAGYGAADYGLRSLSGTMYPSEVGKDATGMWTQSVMGAIGGAVLPTALSVAKPVYSKIKMGLGDVTESQFVSGRELVDKYLPEVERAQINKESDVYKYGTNVLGLKEHELPASIKTDNVNSVQAKAERHKASGSSGHDVSEMFLKNTNTIENKRQDLLFPKKKSFVSRDLNTVGNDIGELAEIAKDEAFGGQTYNKIANDAAINHSVYVDAKTDDLWEKALKDHRLGGKGSEFQSDPKTAYLMTIDPKTEKRVNVVPMEVLKQQEDIHSNLLKKLEGIVEKYDPRSAVALKEGKSLKGITGQMNDMILELKAKPVAEDLLLEYNKIRELTRDAGYKTRSEFGGKSKSKQESLYRDVNGAITDAFKDQLQILEPTLHKQLLKNNEKLKVLLDKPWKLKGLNGDKEGYQIVDDVFSSSANLKAYRDLLSTTTDPKTVNEILENSFRNYIDKKVFHPSEHEKFTWDSINKKLKSDKLQPIFNELGLNNLKTDLQKLAKYGIKVGGDQAVGSSGDLSFNEFGIMRKLKQLPGDLMYGDPSKTADELATEGMAKSAKYILSGAKTPKTWLEDQKERESRLKTLMGKQK